jgi:hypothetical protein
VSFSKNFANLQAAGEEECSRLQEKSRFERQSELDRGWHDMPTTFDSCTAVGFPVAMINHSKRGVVILG